MAESSDYSLCLLPVNRNGRPRNPQRNGQAGHYHRVLGLAGLALIFAVACVGMRGFYANGVAEKSVLRRFAESLLFDAAQNRDHAGRSPEHIHSSGVSPDIAVLIAQHYAVLGALDPSASADMCR
jgi:hypothetical protein